MAVTEVKLSSQGSSGSASGSDNGTVKASYRSAYRVACNSPLDTIDEVLHKFRTTPALPWMNRAFRFGNGFNATVRCKSVDVDQVDKGDGRFIARCSFESLDSQDQDQGQDQNGQPTGNPLLWHDDIDVSFQNIMIPVEQAKLFGTDPKGIQTSIKAGYTGPIVNSAGDPMDPTLEEELRIKVLRITKNFSNYDDSAFSANVNAINNDVFTIDKLKNKFRMSVGKYQAKFGNPTATFQMTGNIAYWRVTGELLINSLPLGWLRYVVDRGRNRRQMPGDKNNHGVTISPGDTSVTRVQIKTSILDSDSNPILDPVLLDGNGQPHDQKKPPVYFIWETKILKPFAGIKW